MEGDKVHTFRLTDEALSDLIGQINDGRYKSVEKIKIVDDKVVITVILNHPKNLPAFIRMPFTTELSG